jgi:hypothetical protein
MDTARVKTKNNGTTSTINKARLLAFIISRVGCAISSSASSASSSSSSSSSSASSPSSSAQSVAIPCLFKEEE